MDSGEGLQTSLWRGCPIRILKAHRLHAAPLERFAGLRVLHRTDAPRHPPRTLSYLWEALVHLSLADFASFAHTCLWLRFGTLLALLPSALGKIEAIIHYTSSVVQVRFFLCLDTMPYFGPLVNIFSGNFAGQNSKFEKIHFSKKKEAESLHKIKQNDIF